jgi:hypothetical protein
MKKLMMVAVAGLLFSGAAFAGGKHCKDKEACKKENKTSSKEKSKTDKEVKKEKTTVSASSSKA